jgi:serine/threonine protein kinase
VTAALPHPPDLPGFRYVEPVPDGDGGYATVFIYEQLQPRRRVAVKVLHGHGVGDIQYQAMQHEATAMAALDDHPHIVPVYAAMMSVDRQPRPCIVMMYCGGPNLMKLVTDKDAPGGRPRLLSLRRVIRLGIQIASAVHAAHEQGIVHRDIKPANILTDNRGNPRLTDFGIAGKLGAVDHGDQQAGLSLPWCPPEILFGQSATVASDLFSLGATLWHLLAGRSPFDVPGQNSPPELEARIADPHPPSTGRADVPQGLEQLLARMMAKQPQRRPRSAAAVVDALEGIEQQLGPPRADEPWHSDQPRASAAPVGDALLRTFHRGQPGAPAAAPYVPLPSPPAEQLPLIHDVPGAVPSKTQLKRRTPTLEPSPVPVPEREPEQSGGRRWVWVAGVVVVGMAVAGLLVARPWQAEAPTQESPVDSGETVIDEGLPPGRPTVTGTRVDDQTLRFEWTYAAPLDSDTYLWRTTGSEQVQTVDEPTVEVTSSDAAQVCIQVKVVRYDGSYGDVAWSDPGCGS